jgi:hypothetical protein
MPFNVNTLKIIAIFIFIFDLIAWIIQIIFIFQQMFDIKY